MSPEILAGASALAAVVFHVVVVLSILRQLRRAADASERTAALVGRLVRASEPEPIPGRRRR